MGSTALWITGLPGSGKSTIADAIKEIHPDFIVLRMDELRKTVTPEPSYSDPERDLVYRSLVYLAEKLTEYGHNVIIDATGNLRIWRDLARELIPGFIEVYLRCPLEVCREREVKRQDRHEAPEDIYKKGAGGAPVPGLNAPYEEPLNPEILIESGSIPVKDSVALINNFLLGRLLVREKD